MLLLLYPALVATFLSVTCLSYLAFRKHDVTNPRPLSELGATGSRSLTYFRIVLVVCGTLFAVTMFGFLIPKVHYSLYLLIAWVVYYGDELLLAIVPARGTWEYRLHNVFAYAMAAGMLATAFIFIISLHGLPATLEVVGMAVMAVAGIMTFIDRKRYILYELAFIYTSHLTILTAAIAVA
jgi:hypothetical protein